MKLILTKFIKENEFDPISSSFNMEIIKLGAKKALSGLGANIKSSSKIQNAQLKKIKLTSTSGAARALFLLKVDKNKAVLLMLRAKNDKAIGENMSMRNTKFKAVLKRNLGHIFSEIRKGDFEEFNL